MRAVLAGVLSLAAFVAGFAEASTLGSPACRQALDVLDRAEATAAASRRASPAAPPGESASASAPAVPAALATARREVARACLAAESDESMKPPPRRAEPPVTVSPVAPPRPAPGASRPPATAATLPAPAAPALPRVITHCDSTGCWTNDGTRLQRSGPVLLGPQGACSVAGTAVTCP
jgi:hypothetical protein